MWAKWEYKKVQFFTLKLTDSRNKCAICWERINKEEGEAIGIWISWKINQYNHKWCIKWLGEYMKNL